MKRMLVVLLGMMLCVGLTACGSGKTEEDVEVISIQDTESVAKVLQDCDMPVEKLGAGDVWIKERLVNQPEDIKLRLYSMFEIETRTAIGSILLAEGFDSVNLEYSVQNRTVPTKYVLGLLKALGVSEENRQRIKEEVLDEAQYGESRSLVVDGFLVSSMLVKQESPEEMWRTSYQHVYISTKDTETDYVEGELKVKQVEPLDVE